MKAEVESCTNITDLSTEDFECVDECVHSSLPNELKTILAGTNKSSARKENKDDIVFERTQLKLAKFANAYYIAKERYGKLQIAHCKLEKQWQDMERKKRKSDEPIECISDLIKALREVEHRVHKFKKRKIQH